MTSFWRNLRSQFLILTLIAIMACLAIWGLRGLLQDRLASPTIPNPNGYDDLVCAGKLIQSLGPNGGGWHEADLAELRSFAKANKPALERARLGLGRDGMANFADTQAGFVVHFEQAGPIRSLSRLMLAEARIAEEEGRFGDAARIDFDILEAGQMTTQGALAISATVGWVIQSQALDQLRRLRDHLSNRDLRSGIKHLERLDHRRTPVKALVDRWERWQTYAFPFWQRLPMWWSGILATSRADQIKMLGQSRDRVERSLRFLLIEWATRLHHEETGRWPRSVAEMVPSILSAEPIDPVTKRPLVCPINLSGELTIDRFAIGQFDGSTTGKLLP